MRTAHASIRLSSKGRQDKFSVTVYGVCAEGANPLRIRSSNCPIPGDSASVSRISRRAGVRQNTSEVHG